MVIKFSTLKSRLKHSDEFDKETASFISAVENELKSKLNLTKLEDYDCDLKLIFVQTGGSEGLFLQAFDKLQEPYYLLTNGSNNSLAASLEILTYLRQRGKRGEILHGSAEYVAERIRRLARISRVAKELKTTRLGVIGKPSDWLIASVPDYSDVKNRLGVTLVDIPIDEVERRVKELHVAEINCDGYPRFDRNELKSACAITQAIRQIVTDYRLDGLTIRCFDLLTSIKSTGCLALAELNRDGITATCEGDIAAMLSMHIMRLLTGQSMFQANPSRINVEDNSIVFAHCTIPLDMVSSYKFDTHFESGIGLAVKGEVRTGQATIFRLSADLQHYYVTRGEIVGNLSESNLCRTQLVIKPDRPVTDILKEPCGNHHIIAYGDHVEAVTELLNEILG